MPIFVGKSVIINGTTYEVQKILGKGGMSIVYAAVDLSTNQRVAIKEYLYATFYDPYTHENDCELYWENEILNTKAQASSGKQCVEVLNFEKREDQQTPEYFIVLKFIEGQTFLDFYRDFVMNCRGLENLDLASIVRYIFIPLAELLEFCHEKQFLVHRDFAVSNIIIQKHEDSYWPVLIDWGVSKYLGPEWIHYTPKPYMTDEMTRDIPVNQKGAPPEVRFGFMPTAVSDIYYFGHLMYFIFTGGIIREDSENLSPEDFILNPKKINVFIPDEYNNVVTKLTQYEPADRPKNMTEVILMLKKLITLDNIHFDFDFDSTDDKNG